MTTYCDDLEMTAIFCYKFGNLHEKCLKFMITLIITMYLYCFLSIHQVLTVAAIADQWLFSLKINLV